jgi:hypothetical protein
MVYLLTLETLKSLKNSKGLQLLEKNQKNNIYKNYYFTPNIGLKIFNAKVLFVDNKSMTIEVDKWKYPGFITMLREIDEELLKLYHEKSNQVSENVYSFFMEKENTILFRMSLPNYRGKYNITSYTNSSDQDVFTLPRSGMIYNYIIFEIRNIWEQLGKKTGFNLELKCVDCNF